MYARLAPRGFEVLGFPSNQFGGQEPGSPAEIRKFVDGYGVTFPMFAKIDVNGPNTAPLYAFLKSGTPLFADIKWNFGKFLVGKNGKKKEKKKEREEEEELYCS
ncbi:thioredoxin-like protein [Pavlovales sp. CCMP2436]|nr:thioredoxin-like protein [Pavlovales sp. CCMP2436]